MSNRKQHHPEFDAKVVLDTQKGAGEMNHDLMHRVPLELVAGIACPHAGDFPSKVWEQSVY